MNLQFIYNNPNLSDAYPDQVSFGINLGFAISALIKIIIIDNVIPLVFHKKPKNYVVNGNALLTIYDCISYEFQALCFWY